MSPTIFINLTIEFDHSKSYDKMNFLLSRKFTELAYENIIILSESNFYI